MSTRANIIVTNNQGEHLIFYRHSDGYPETTVPSLIKFLNLLHKQGRPNLTQGAGHLIMLGAMEYDSIPGFKLVKNEVEDIVLKRWKVGAYEPTTMIHADIEHLYVVNIDRMTIKEIEIPEDCENWQPQRVIALHYH